MNLFNKKTYLLLMICFAFTSINAQQTNNSNQSLSTVEQKSVPHPDSIDEVPLRQNDVKSTSVNDSPHPDSVDDSPQRISKRTSVSDSTHPDSVDKVQGGKSAERAAVKNTTNPSQEENESVQDNTTNEMRHDGTIGSQPQPREKNETVSTSNVEHNRDGSARQASTKAKTAKVEANVDGSAKVKKEEN